MQAKEIREAMANKTLLELRLGRSSHVCVVLESMEHPWTTGNAWVVRTADGVYEAASRDLCPLQRSRVESERRRVVNVLLARCAQAAQDADFKGVEAVADSFGVRLHRSGDRVYVTIAELCVLLGVSRAQPDIFAQLASMRAAAGEDLAEIFDGAQDNIVERRGPCAE